ncbi:MAG: methionine ABC transporter ATP-binding protein [Helicobacter sp.]|nr:methionine ABC transporter ATP-binding protein [Helicobacter sp.]
MDYIEVSGLNKSYGGFQVLKNIDLSIKKGTIFGLVGHSGAGKSTLLRTFNGLERFDSGCLKINNTEINRLKYRELRAFRRNIGMIFQNFSLMSRKNVYENIILPLQCWGEKIDKKRIDTLLELVGLQDKAKVYPNALSGGQKQRVAIARALVMNPHLLLSDEATSALDPSTTGSILELLERINCEFGVTIVVVTHEMEVVKKICKEAAFMEKGEILSQGSVQELFLEPSKKMREFLGENEILPNDGLNIRLYFPQEVSQNPIITQMARDLEINCNIVWGHLESFGGVALGVLVINVDSAVKESVCEYLSKSGVHWEIV